MFKLLAACCVLASVYHFYGVFDSGLRAEYAWQRHAVFGGLNLMIAYFTIYRSWYFVPFLLALVLQQLIGHGQSLLTSIVDSSSISAIDVGVILFMPTLLVIYVTDLLYASKVRGKM